MRFAVLQGCQAPGDACRLGDDVTRTVEACLEFLVVSTFTAHTLPEHRHVPKMAVQHTEGRGVYSYPTLRSEVSRSVVDPIGDWSGCGLGVDGEFVVWTYGAPQHSQGCEIYCNPLVGLWATGLGLLVDAWEWLGRLPLVKHRSNP